jgi:Fe2+ transport system protein FeoA
MVSASSQESAVPLSELREGATGLVAETSIDPADALLLSAMGLRAAAPIRLARAGEPCIVQVNGTRIGLNSSLARGIHVHIQ